MPRKIVSRETDCPFHVTARSNNQEWFDLPMETVWQVFENQLFFISFGFKVHIHGFVLMNNHFHLLISAPLGNLSGALRWFMTETSREIARLTGRKNHIYGQRNYQCLIGSYHYYMHAYKYLYRNPVEAGLCANVEEYKFSTLHRMLGLSPLRFPMMQDLLFEDFDRNLKWLNTSVSKQSWKDVGNALKKSRFKLRKDRGRNTENRLETALL